MSGTAQPKYRITSEPRDSFMPCVALSVRQDELDRAKMADIRGGTWAKVGRTLVRIAIEGAAYETMKATANYAYNKVDEVVDDISEAVANYQAARAAEEAAQRHHEHLLYVNSKKA